MGIELVNSSNAEHVAITGPAVNGIFNGNEMPEADERTITPDEHIFREGDKASRIYEVLDGTLVGARTLADGGRHVLFFAWPGDIIGYAHGADRQFDCRAATATRIRAIPVTRFDRAMETDPGFRTHVLEIIARQLSEAYRHSTLLARATARQKIASFLFGLALRAGPTPTNGPVRIALPMRRVDIADYLGTTLETVSRTVTGLKASGIIDFPSSSGVIIHDIGRLRTIAEGD